ncbi:MAG: DUF302 domain-containing protein [Actinomycetota bacterium]
MSVATDRPRYGSRVSLAGVRFDDAVAAVRAALAEQGFGVLTEIDVRATMKAKLDAEVPSQVIFGACRPASARAALQAEPSIGLLLPCNVVVRETDDATIVEAVDPDVLVRWTGNEALAPVATDVGERLKAALDVVRSWGEAR